MRIVVWWSSLSRAYQNALVLFSADLLLLVGALLDVHVLHLVWDALTDSVPNILESIVLQLLGLIRHVVPGVALVNSVVVIYGTLFLSLATIHVLIGFGLGFLFDHTQRNRWWSFANFFTLIVVLFCLHLFLLFVTAPFG